MNIEIRRVEPGDYKAVQQCTRSPTPCAARCSCHFHRRKAGRSGSPSSARMTMLWSPASRRDRRHAVLMATTPSPRRKHVGWLGMAVHEQMAVEGRRHGAHEGGDRPRRHWLDLRAWSSPSIPTTRPPCAALKKLGFVIEGTHKKYAFRDGGYVDAYTMARGAEVQTR